MQYSKLSAPSIIMSAPGSSVLLRLLATNDLNRFLQAIKQFQVQFLCFGEDPNLCLSFLVVTVTSMDAKSLITTIQVSIQPY